MSSPPGDSISCAPPYDGSFEIYCKGERERKREKEREGGERERRGKEEREGGGGKRRRERKVKRREAGLVTMEEGEEEGRVEGGPPHPVALLVPVWVEEREAVTDRPVILLVSEKRSASLSSAAYVPSGDQIDKTMCS